MRKATTRLPSVPALGSRNGRDFSVISRLEYYARSSLKLHRHQCWNSGSVLLGHYRNFGTSTNSLTSVGDLRCVVADIRTGLINGFPSRVSGPQGLKPAFLLAGSGTAKAVPFPKPFMRPVVVNPRSYPFASATAFRSWSASGEFGFSFTTRSSCCRARAA